MEEASDAAMDRFADHASRPDSDRPMSALKRELVDLIVELGGDRTVSYHSNDETKIEYMIGIYPPQSNAGRRGEVATVHIQNVDPDAVPPRSLQPQSYYTISRAAEDSEDPFIITRHIDPPSPDSTNSSFQRRAAGWPERPIPSSAEGKVIEGMSYRNRSHMTFERNAASKEMGHPLQIHEGDRDEVINLINDLTVLRGSTNG